MIGVGVVRREAKSRWDVEGGRGVGVLSNSPKTFSDSTEDIDRRLVRAGVRIVAGGALEPDELDHEIGRSRTDLTDLVSGTSSSGTVSGCLVSREDRDSMSDIEVRRIVVVLGLSCKVLMVLSNGSDIASSGVVGAEDSMFWPLEKGEPWSSVEFSDDSGASPGSCKMGESGS